MKEEARQVLIDELDEAAAAQRAPEPQPAAPSKNAARRDALDDDVEMGYDATAANTPGAETPLPPPSSGQAQAGAEADGEEEEDDDDLFGDGDDDDEDDHQHSHSHASGADPEVEAQGGDEEEGDEGDEEEEDDQNDDLETMLRAELGDMSDARGDVQGMEGMEVDMGMDMDPSPSGAGADMGQGEREGQPPDERAQANAMAALEDFALLGGLDAGSPAVGGNPFGVEGGVGMRRLATGVPDGEDDEDEDSSDSDD